ncbi:C40 family peptidase [Nesterenkonia halotolerans]|uniref:Cell wall-associated NlpC family hydrolase n=1 Tax=Nesterenkonia halotolerans TaxID=225325 RepID=A0ABR9J634_9MICC|nr:C40 family peptidase [Nesterenkonia halotolerans]MBE1514459.1 cell wall-associated NlpC family hydrolase [Nesterenkonia halotolerans]
MSFTDVIGRVGQIESRIAQVSGAQRQTSTASAAAASASQSGALQSVLADQTSTGGTDFSAVMRSLTGTSTGSGAGSGAASASGAAGSAGASASAGASGSSSANGAAAASTSRTEGSARSAPGSGSGSGSRSGGVDGGDVVAQAKKYLGIPYVWGGTDPDVGLDCSGLVQLVFKDLGVKVPRVTYDQLKTGTEIPTLAEARPGDLIVTRNGDHIGIYAGDNKILHAPRPGKNVEIREMFEGDADILTIRRVVDAPGSSSASRSDGEIAAAQRSQFEASQSSRSGANS